MRIAKWWHRAFLEERPSISLGLFRFAVAFTVGAHMIPSFLQLNENYLAGAFKTKNLSFFPLSILHLIEKSPDGVVLLFVAGFYFSLLTFSLGWHSQLSCILMTSTCYYFYALNNYHIGTLSFDILLVTLFLMCVTNYHGDFLSVDSLRRGDSISYRRPRPFFVQRLLQLQLAWTFWYTGLSKIAGGGNWLTEKPYYYLMHYPPIGVVRDFPLSDWLGQYPSLCYGLGIALIIFEATVPVLWFCRRTRTVGIGLGIAFQLMLWATLHVPTIFLFLFPPMMLLFIEPEKLVAWIEARRLAPARGERGRLLYDGRCGFCLESVKRLQVVDIFGSLELLDFHTQDISKLNPSLTQKRCASEMILLEPDGRISGGFEAFRRLTMRLPLLLWLALFVHLPGASWIGNGVYRWIAQRRYLFHRNPTCITHQCALGESDRTSSEDDSENSASGSLKI